MLKATTAVLILFAAALPAGADIALFTDGRSMKIAAYKVSGETEIQLTLKNGGKLTMPIERVERIVDEEVTRFMRWYRSLMLKPTVTAFRSHFERIAQEELERHRARFRPEDQPAAESLTRSIVQKLLHRPTTRLNRAGEDGSTGIRRIDAVRDLFGIEREEGTDEDRDTR